MIIVVDASVAIKWFVEEPLHEQALLLLDARHELHAPDFIVAELTNILWKKILRGEIDETEGAKAAVSIIRGLPKLHAARSINSRALDIAITLRHPAYDCLYLACAEMVAGTLITADERFLRVAHAAGLGMRVQPLAMLQ